MQEKTSGVATDLLQGPGIDNLLERGGVWLLPGELHNTAMTLDGSGNVQQYYFYQPFGQIAEMGGGGTAIPYQFTGREADASGLMVYRARYYNPGWGRFVSRDPLGVGGLADVAAEASVRDQVRPDDGMRPGAPGAVAGSGSAAGGPWEQGSPARVLGLGVRATGPAWVTGAYAYVANDPTNAVDPSGLEQRKLSGWKLALYVFKKIVEFSGNYPDAGPLDDELIDPQNNAPSMTNSTKAPPGFRRKLPGNYRFDSPFDAKFLKYWWWPQLPPDDENEQGQ